MNLLLLSEYRIVSGSHWISRRWSFWQFCDREMIIWSMWTRVLMRRNQPLAVPHTNTLLHSNNSQTHYHCNLMMMMTMTMMLIIIFCPPSQFTKPRAWKLSKMLNNGCNDFLFGVHCVEEGDRIRPLQSYGQAFKQKDCFSGVLGDDCAASANRLGLGVF